MLVIFLCVFLAISFNQVILGLSYGYLTREEAVMKSYKEFISGVYWQSLIVQIACYYLLFSQYAFTSSFFVLVALTSVLMIISISDYYSLTVPNEASYGLIMPSILISFYIFDRTLSDLFLGGFLGFAILMYPKIFIFEI